MKTIKIGIVGAGGMGRVHYANYAAIEGAQVAAICGSSANEMNASREWGLPRFDTITQMCQAVELDVVDICTPTFLHHDQVMEALANDKHTITEKPMALSSADAKEMLEEAKKRGRLLFVAQVLQFTKEVGFLRQAVQSEEFGKPLDGYFERLSACPRWAVGGWLFDRSKSGLLPYDLHIHDLDVIISLFGKPQTFSYTASQGRDKTYPEQMRYLYTFPGGLTVGAEAAWFNADIPFTARWRVSFENAVMVNDGTALTLYRFGHEPKVYNTADEVMISTGINVPPCGWYYNELKHFVECIREGRPTPFVTEQTLCTVMELLEEMRG